MPRDIEALIEQRIGDWTRPHDEDKKRRRGPLRPNVAISHAMGANGEEIAQGVAESLGFRLYDREIIDLVAERTHVQRKLVEALDEQLQSNIDWYITSVLKEHYLDPERHFRELARAISAVAAQGGAVIVGRGAGLFLDRARTVSIRVDAPFDVRCARLEHREQLGLEEARARVARSDANRAAYFRKHYHVSWQDALLYDLVVNTEYNGIPSVVQSIGALFDARFPDRAVELHDDGAKVERSV